MFISSCQAGQNVQHWVCQALVGGVHTRRYRKLQQDWQCRVRARQNADLGLNNIYVVSVLAHAEFALNPKRQEPSVCSFSLQESDFREPHKCVQ
jgi:hypothetical protein